MERKLGTLLVVLLTVLFVGSPIATTLLVNQPDSWADVVVVVATLLYSIVKVAVFMAAVALLVHLALTRRWKWVAVYVGALVMLAIFSRFAYGFTGDSASRTAFYFFDHFLPGNRWLAVSGPTYVANFVYFLATFLAWTLIFRGSHAASSA